MPILAMGGDASLGDLEVLKKSFKKAGRVWGMVLFLRIEIGLTSCAPFLDEFGDKLFFLS